MGTVLYQELIRRKRDGGTLSGAEIASLVAGITSGGLSDAQLGAFAMAVVLRGMELSERVALTEAMRDSGEVLAWARGPVVDKHSTGGIGDTVSLVLAPALAACGAVVPMISGRGLGHTGGTLDKLGAIPGYDVTPDAALMRRVVDQVGCAIIGQTGTLAPADRRFYAVRDVTATVESRDLITASILSKKLAAGIGALVLDVKCGNGAFMPDLAAAEGLARALVEVANGAGCPTSALITDMNAPLAAAAGNALEVAVAVDTLTGRARDPRLYALTLALGAEALVRAGLAESAAEGQDRMAAALDSGAAAERFAQMVAALGGPADFLERVAHHLPTAPVIRTVPAPVAGVVAGYDTRALGLAVIGLGGGRRQADDRIDLRVGLSQIAAVGQAVNAGDPVALVHAAEDASAARAVAEVTAACRIAESASAEPLVLGRIA
ncbi:MAG: thymidine phosphorylase [Rhodobacteraceae bacterium]|nr:thymidine phosphorylase [Paracoccaceae bacterium]